MHNYVQKTTCFLAAGLTLLAIAVFAAGFFPHKAFIAGLSAGHGSSISSPFDKVIFMVVDALRSDFVYGPQSSFNFTQSLIRSGAAIPFTGHASPPTITMPRVKAITTGSVPSFLDVVLNFAESDTSSTLATQDTWLAQMKTKPGGKLVMYGDDTWLKLFPGFFERADGTTSFFVSDFTEVDNNVTRHVPEELRNDDWSGMVLHYLGLDHIGHKSGPKSPNMPGKQLEMDEVVREIYLAMETYDHLKSSLLVLSGDHGMNEAGNHGGSSLGEASTALVFVSPMFRSVFNGLQCPTTGSEGLRFYETVEQSDIAPTLAALLGFPVPRNNLGIVIPAFLDLWKQDSEKLELLFANALQMSIISEMTFPTAFSQYPSFQACGLKKPDSDAAQLACNWRDAEHAFDTANSGIISIADAIVPIQNFLRRGQDTLSGTASNYDLSKMYFGIGIVALGVVLASVSVSLTDIEPGLGAFAYGAIMLSYGATMFASSYVEEEQQFWYWALGGWLMALQFKQHRFQATIGLVSRISTTAASLAFGILRRWNQTGQKYAGHPDISSRILPAYTSLLWLLVISTYILIAYRISTYAVEGLRPRQTAVLAIPTCVAAFSFKVAFSAADAPELLRGVSALEPIVSLITNVSLVAQARVVFFGIASLAAFAVYHETTEGKGRDRKAFLFTLHDLLTLFLVTQSRTSNVPIFLIFYLQLESFRINQSLTLSDLNVTSLVLQYSSFFILGGSNAISSVDLSNAYNGISGYDVVGVGILTFLSNWAGPIWWVSANVLLMSERGFAAPRSHILFRHFALLTLFTAFSTLAVMVACMVLREHLFIWTVFSPKFLFTIAWVAGHHLIVNGLFGYGLLGMLMPSYNGLVSA